jgi:CDP-alcohol phosphatidyltransferase-like enzyme
VRVDASPGLRAEPLISCLVAFTLGLAGAALLPAGQGLAGGLLVHASSVADGVDGEVARLQLRGGPRGALLDGVLDRVGDAAILAGLGLWGLNGHGPRGVLVLPWPRPPGRCCRWHPRTGQPPWGYHPRPSGPWGGCCWSL